MWNDLLLVPFIIAFVLTATGCLFLVAFPLFEGRVWRTGQRHAGKQLLPRLGGVVMCIAFLGAIALDTRLVLTRDTWGLLVAATLACLFGLWDDVRELGLKTQIFFQGLLVAILFFFGLQVSALRNPFGETLILSGQGSFMLILGIGLLLCWVVLVMNAVNWLDGLDGLLGGVSLVTFFVMVLLSLKPEVNQPPVAILAGIALGVTAGFLLFNVPPARIMAGTSGSMFIGIVIAGLAVIAGTKIATALLVLSLPVADALWVIGERLRSGQSVFRPDQRHLHYKLRELGWSERQIAGFFFLLTAMIGWVALNTEALGKLLATLLIFVSLFLFLFAVAYWRKRKTLPSIYKCDPRRFLFRISIGSIVMIGVVLVLAGLVPWYKGAQVPEAVGVYVGEQYYTLEYARTREEQSRGLGEREGLCQTCAMAFPFSPPKKQAFWMGGMRFSLDIAWLSSDGSIVHIVHRVSPDSQEVFYPQAPASLVLEFNAGVLDDVMTGEKLRFVSFPSESALER